VKGGAPDEAVPAEVSWTGPSVRASSPTAPNPPGPGGRGPEGVPKRAGRRLPVIGTCPARQEFDAPLGNPESVGLGLGNRLDERVQPSVPRLCSPSQVFLKINFLSSLFFPFPFPAQTFYYKSGVASAKRSCVRGNKVQETCHLHSGEIPAFTHPHVTGIFEVVQMRVLMFRAV